MLPILVPATIMQVFKLMAHYGHGGLILMDNWATAGTNATYAIKQNGTLWAWGGNNHGQLGNGTTTSRLLPAQVLPGTTWSKVSAGDSYVVAQKTDGTLWSCGYNAFGQLGGQYHRNLHIMEEYKIVVSKSQYELLISSSQPKAVNPKAMINKKT